MSYVCFICEKKTSVGRSQRHKRGVAGKRWRNRAQSTPRLFKPNLQKTTLSFAGEEKQVLICAKCLKKIKKDKKIGHYKNVSVAHLQ